LRKIIPFAGLTPSLRYAANGDSEMEGSRQLISQSYRQPENSVNHRFRQASNSSTRTAVGLECCCGPGEN